MALRHAPRDPSLRLCVTDALRRRGLCLCQAGCGGGVGLVLLVPKPGDLLCAGRLEGGLSRFRRREITTQSPAKGVKVGFAAISPGQLFDVRKAERSAGRDLGGLNRAGRNPVVAQQFVPGQGGTLDLDDRTVDPGEARKDGRRRERILDSPPRFLPQAHTEGPVTEQPEEWDGGLTRASRRREKGVDLVPKVLGERRLRWAHDRASASHSLKDRHAERLAATRRQHSSSGLANGVEQAGHPGSWHTGQPAKVPEKTAISDLFEDLASARPAASDEPEFEIEAGSSNHLGSIESAAPVLDFVGASDHGDDRPRRSCAYRSEWRQEGVADGVRNDEDVQWLFEAAQADRGLKTRRNDERARKRRAQSPEVVDEGR